MFIPCKPSSKGDSRALPSSVKVSLGPAGVQIAQLSRLSRRALELALFGTRAKSACNSSRRRTHLCRDNGCTLLQGLRALQAQPQAAGPSSTAGRDLPCIVLPIAVENARRRPCAGCLYLPRCRPAGLRGVRPVFRSCRGRRFTHPFSAHVERARVHARPAGLRCDRRYYRGRRLSLQEHRMVAVS